MGLINQRPVFIVGFPRSGTTFLQSLLYTQEEFWSLPETHFYTDIINFDRNTDRDNVDFVFEQAKRWLGIDLKREVITAYLNDRNEKKFFELVINEYVLQKHINVDVRKLRLIEKTPYHFLYIDRILTLFPESKIIGIVRHPLDAIESYSNNLKEHFTTFKTLASELNNCLNILEKFHKQNKVKVIKYEDLFHDKLNVVSQLSDYLGFEFNQSRLSNYTFVSKDLKMDYEHWKNKNSIELVKSNVRLTMPLKEQLMIQRINRKHFEKFQYRLKYPWLSYLYRIFNKLL